ncbi:MAG: hypothetical protein LAP85_10435 [Acidobacteriia bacterium]|nr:hypothetical protein [Terriglobia bacterium]
MDARFECDLRSFVGKYTAVWLSSAVGTPTSAMTYTASAQRRNERNTDLLIDSMEKELRNYPSRPREQSGWRERIFVTLRQFGTKSFRFPDSHFDVIFSPDYFAVTRAFARQARAFDESIETDALAQALRNVWVMNCLQMFLGRRPSLSPSVFAYSMLYPYTDNHLDQPKLPYETKRMACRRLGLRLSGRNIEPCDAHEAAVFRLVEMIEGEYPRATSPEVYSSLLAIHAGQVKSLGQQHTPFAPDETTLLRISVEKGGSSVLADGWLVGGEMRRAEADFFFGFGVMLQLLDDLQDLPDDRNAGHWTLFTRTASAECLDRHTSQLWHFVHNVLDSRGCLADSHGLELRDLIRRNSTILLLRAMAESAGYYSADYVHHMERFSPLSFAFLRDRRVAIEKRFARIWPPLARRRKLRSIFDLLG